MCFLKKILGILHPTDKILHSQETSLWQGKEVIDSVINVLNSMRTNKNEMEFESLFIQCQAFECEEKDQEQQLQRQQSEVGKECKLKEEKGNVASILLLRISMSLNL